MSDSISKLLIERYGVMVFLGVILVLAVIAILHFGIKFDINMYIASRKERHRKLAQSYCPHLDFIPRNDDSFQVNSLFCSPPGTLNWFCSRCGAVLPYEPDQEELKAKVTYYLNHPKAYKKAMKSYDRHAKNLSRLLMLILKIAAAASSERTSYNADLSLRSTEVHFPRINNPATLRRVWEPSSRACPRTPRTRDCGIRSRC